MKHSLWLLLCLVGLNAELQAVESPLSGYPYNPEGAANKYECSEGKQVRLANSKKSLLLYRLCIDEAFSEAARNIARQSFERMVEKLSDEKVFSCAMSHVAHFPDEIAHSNLTFNQYLEKYLVPGLGERGQGGIAYAATVYLSALQAPEKSEKPLDGEMGELYGEGYLNFFKNPRFVAEGKEWKQFISIAARKDLLGANTFAFGAHTDFWSSMFAIAFSKNMGIGQDVGGVSQLLSHAKCVYWGGEIPSLFGPLKPLGGAR